MNRNICLWAVCCLLVATVKSIPILDTEPTIELDPQVKDQDDLIDLAFQRNGETQNEISNLNISRTHPLPGPEDIILFPGKVKDTNEVVLQSANGKAVLFLTRFGDLNILRKCDLATLWTQVANGIGERISMEVNGNLVVYGPYNEEIGWQSGTNGSTGADLRMQDDGFLCVFKDEKCVWSNGQRFNTDCADSDETPSNAPVKTTPIPSVDASETENVGTESDVIIKSGERKDPQDITFKLHSVNYQAVLKFDLNQDLVVVRTCDNAVLWKQPVVGLGRRLVMKADGNLVVYGYSVTKVKSVAWESKTSGNPGADLRLQDDGHLCVYKDGRCVWSNGKRFFTACKSPAASNDDITVLQSGEKMTMMGIGPSTVWSQNGSVGLHIAMGNGQEKLSLFRTCDFEVLWSPVMAKNLSSNETVRLFMQPDGNVVIYGTEEDELKGEGPLWAAGHYRLYAGAVLKIQNNGVLCVFKNDDCLWTSPTPDRGVNCIAATGNTTVSATEGSKSESWFPSWFFW